MMTTGRTHNVAHEFTINGRRNLRALCRCRDIIQMRISISAHTKGQNFSGAGMFCMAAQARGLGNVGMDDGNTTRFET